MCKLISVVKCTKCTTRASFLAFLKDSSALPGFIPYSLNNLDI